MESIFRSIIEIVYIFRTHIYLTYSIKSLITKFSIDNIYYRYEKFMKFGLNEIFTSFLYFLYGFYFLLSNSVIIINFVNNTSIDTYN
jgi:hypothetical protein